MNNFSVLDIKTGFELLPYTAIQLAAYENIYAETLKMKTEPTLEFSEEGHCYKLSGVSIPSVTQVLQTAGLVDFSRVPLDVLEAARRFGTAVHKACELLDKGTLDERSLDPNLWPYLDAWSDFKKDYKPEFIEIEKPICSITYRVAGTPDRIAESNKRRRYAVLLTAEGYKASEYKSSGDWQIFLSAMSVANWKRRNLK